MGSERNSLRSDSVHFFFHFLLRTNGSVKADKSNGNFKSYFGNSFSKA